MLNAAEIIEEVKTLHSPNPGILALVKYDCCIMDETCEPYPYKEDGQCPDWNRCDDATYMLACISTRNPEQLSQWVIDIYNSAMKR